MDSCPFCGSKGVTEPDGLNGFYGDEDAEQAAECSSCDAWAPSIEAWNTRAKPRTLLTWSEPDADGDIRAGSYIVTVPTASVETYRAHFCPVSRATTIRNCADLNSAKLACEQHARKMLGWEV